MKTYSLSAKERIKSRKDFEKIYSEGRTVFSADRKVKAVFIFDEADGEQGVKIAPGVSKKAGGAVWRNRVKRLLKESFRLNKQQLVNTCIEKNLLVKIVLSPVQFNEKSFKKIYLSDLMPGVVSTLEKIKKSL